MVAVAVYDKHGGLLGAGLCLAQYGRDAISGMPTNLYGPYDNFHPENSHVLPALMRRFHEAKKTGAKEVVVWGTGTPLREFLHTDDLAGTPSPPAAGGPPCAASHGNRKIIMTI